MSDFMKIAITAAREAGAVHNKYYNTDYSIQTKSTEFDLVTAADIEAEKAVVDSIRSHVANHNILAEEGTYEKTPSEYCWVIDPLDGTNNFSYGLPLFCVSIGLVKNGEFILGVIYDCMRDEMFCAQKGGGAYLNDKRITVKDVDTLSKSILITGFYYDRGKEMLENLERIKHFFQVPIMGLRRLGAAALDLCYVACGRGAGFWEFQLSPWDFAAGKVLIEEAGGKVTGRYGEPVSLQKSFIVASNGRIHQDMLHILK